MWRKVFFFHFLFICVFFLLFLICATQRKYLFFAVSHKLKFLIFPRFFITTANPFTSRLDIHEWLTSSWIFEKLYILILITEGSVFNRILNKIQFSSTIQYFFQGCLMLVLQIRMEILQIESRICRVRWIKTTK